MLTRGFRTHDLLRKHYYAHNSDTRFASSDAYLRRADEFLGGPLAADGAECRRSGGALVRYTESTGEFGVLHADGYIATFYILTGPVERRRQYFEDNCLKP